MLPTFTSLIVSEAREWIGTPYVHQHSVKGYGSDCLGLIRGVWRMLHSSEPVLLEPYTPDWSEISGNERLQVAAAENLVEIPISLDAIGSVLLFRMRDRFVAKHLGILAKSPVGFTTLIHAYSGYGVVETPITKSWERKIAAQYNFPEKV